MPRGHILNVALLVLVTGPLALAQAPSKTMKVFVLAGQSNMVGWGDSLKLSEELRIGSDRVLMFENGKWQPLRPFKKATKNQEMFGMTQFSFGPEIAFADAVAKAWPQETIGIVKLAVGGTSILTWKPNWSKEDANRVGQGRVGSLYKRLIAKVKQAEKSRDIEIVGLLWLQGGGDMKNMGVAKEYLDNLKSLVGSVREDLDAASLPFFCGSIRRAEDPTDLSNLVPSCVAGPYPAVEWVLKAQWDVQRELPNARTIILRDINTHPKNVHYDTRGQLRVGKLFATVVLNASLRIGDHTPQQILAILGANGRDVASESKRTAYRRVFGFIDTNGDGQHTKKEFVDDGRYLTQHVRQGIFRAADANGDGIVSVNEYIENRTITDEAKAIFKEMDANDDGKLTAKEFASSGKIKDKALADQVFKALDSDDSGELVIPEYLRVWGRWARSG